MIRMLPSLRFSTTRMIISPSTCRSFSRNKYSSALSVMYKLFKQSIQYIIRSCWGSELENWIHWLIMWIQNSKKQYGLLQSFISFLLSIIISTSTSEVISRILLEANSPNLVTMEVKSSSLWEYRRQPLSRNILSTKRMPYIRYSGFVEEKYLERAARKGESSD